MNSCVSCVIGPPVSAGAVSGVGTASAHALPQAPLPEQPAKSNGEPEVCPVCLGNVDDPVKLSKCSHVFCRDCWESAFKMRPLCPVCKTSYGEESGNQPPGRMAVNKSPRPLPGYEGFGSIQITYVFDDGVQGPEHPNPGQMYHGTLRQAYLPDNSDGQRVLALLQRAFHSRLTFTIGTSVTSGQRNAVVWNDIHHKTNISGGPVK